jgi:hypothetical protein
MTRDPLEALVQLRHLAVAQARRGLADCLRVESQAAQSVAGVEVAIQHETDVATSLASGDAEVEAFAAWLRHIRPKEHAAHVAEAEAKTATFEARAVLAVARAAVGAAEAMLDEPAASKEAEVGEPARQR